MNIAYDPLSFPNTPLPNAEYHTYRFEWFPNWINFYIDGVLLRTVTNPDALPDPGKDQRLHLNLWGQTTSIGYSSLHAGGRQFVLMKGEGARDSRFREGLHCHLTAETSSDGPLLNIDIVARNSGTAVWRPSGKTVGSVNAALVTRSREGNWDYEFRRHYPISRHVHPAEQACFRLTIPRSEFEGRELYVDLVAEQVIWFGQNGASPLRLI
ncbi:family 16 glycosylhydrolase [Reyranella sp.]|uniref:family 16 glycosylhydrolase n=1 Tax=Reyranella sp. TaxID=1929291 RepID=UPI0026166A29|nr:family 16 glycosylhydrolase [Reyranella sp.]HQS18255.1 family 16 glycosylhydrolase [Reyranella sp.]HQT09906.1 family 16 glycosylhydrolase [Reyranella sp.]